MFYSISIKQNPFLVPLLSLPEITLKLFFYNIKKLKVGELAGDLTGCFFKEKKKGTF